MISSILLVALATLSLFTADLKEIQKEPNLERRARLALEHAGMEFEGAKSAYAAGDREKTGLDLREMANAVEIARDALAETGKNPRRHVKPFKMAETETHALLKRVEGLENAMDFDDRVLIEGPKATVQEVHDAWLNEIISGR